MQLIVTFEAELITADPSQWPTLRLGKLLSAEAPGLQTAVQNASVERATPQGGAAALSDPVWYCNCSFSGTPHEAAVGTTEWVHNWAHDEQSDRAYRARQR